MDALESHIAQGTDILSTASINAAHRSPSLKAARGGAILEQPIAHRLYRHALEAISHNNTLGVRPDVVLDLHRPRLKVIVRNRTGLAQPSPRVAGIRHEFHQASDHEAAHGALRVTPGVAR
jgi:hypothetical protein